MKIEGDTYVILWSPHQKHFHIETVNDMLEKNRAIFARGMLGDYIVLGFEKTRALAKKSCTKLRAILDRDKSQD